MRGLEVTEIVSLARGLLGDFGLGGPLTAGLVSLASNGDRDATHTIALYSGLHALVDALVADGHPAVDSIANYLINDLFPALNPDGSGSGNSQASRVAADVLVDVVWQVDQDLENGSSEYRQPPVASTSTSQRPEDKAAHRASLDLASRDRLAQLVHSLLTARILDAATCRERLDVRLLASRPLQLLHADSGFKKTENRARTALYYKQQKFNLLREESEGYAKLIVELQSNMGPAHSTATARSIESDATRMQRAKDVNDKVKTLIGNFELDPARTLDIVLDMFSDQLVNHHQFFIDYLSVSPWCPANRAVQPPVKLEGDAAEGKGKGKAPPVISLQKDTGSYRVAQVLGLKFRYYQTVEPDDIPDKLYLMTALLIWNGFVKFADIWPHLSPTDAEFAKVDQKYRDAQAALARSVGGSNALASAGALVDDDGPMRGATKKATKAVEATVELPDQRLGLLRALLSIGDLQHSLFVLSQCPALAAANLDVSDLVLRLLAVAIAPAYAELSFAQTHASHMQEITAERRKFIAPATKPVKAPSATTTLTGRALADPNKEQVFFFAEWQDRIPLCENWEQALDVLELFLPVVGIFISRDMTLWTRICRMIVHDIKNAPQSSRAPRWLDVVRLHILPSISLLESHAVAAIEIWRVLDLLPMAKRFSFYGEWKDTFYRRIPALAVRKAESERDVKSILRRLSTQNVKKLGKTFAKVAHTNPTVVFHVTLNQIQSYDNLISPVLEATRYLTDFGYDVLAYSVLDALSSDRPKTKDDGTSTALWLQGLASFTGQLYRRWVSMAPSIPVILQYLVNQLSAGNSKDLIILRELITRMTNIAPFADLMDSEVLKLAGGKLLRNEVFNQTDIEHLTKRSDKMSLGNAKTRLAKALDTSGLAMPLLVSIAASRQQCPISTIAHLKSLGNLYDECHAVFFQYLELLSATLGATDEYAKQVPSVDHLMERFSISAPIAFDIARPKHRLAMKIADDEMNKTQQLNLAKKLTAEKAAAAAASQPATPPTATLSATSEDANALPTGGSSPAAVAPVEDVVMADAGAPAALVPLPASVAPSRWHPGLVDLIDSMSNLLPESTLSSIGAPFFVTFWTYTLHDILLPGEGYTAEADRLAAMMAQVRAPGAFPKSEFPNLEQADKDRFTDSLTKLTNDLIAERGAHGATKSRTLSRLNKEKALWFPRALEKKALFDVGYNLYQDCVLPRAKLSLPDAVYAFQFIKRMHAMNTPGFQIVIFYARAVFSEQGIGRVLFACSENEARNFAKFLFEVVSDLHIWYNDAGAYTKEGAGITPSTPAGLIGFRKKVGDGSSTPREGALPHYSHTEFHILVTKWYNYATDSIVSSFSSGEYMSIKNSILVMTKVSEHFPLHYDAGAKLLTAVEELIATEKREDLKILAQGYKAVLMKRRKHWIGYSDRTIAPLPTPSAHLSPVAKPSASTAPIPSRPAVSTSGVPSGPKYGLPPKPGVPGSSTSAATILPPSVPTRPAASRNESDSKAVPMDVDRPPQRLHSDQSDSRRTAPSNGHGSQPHALPARPAASNSNGVPVRPTDPTTEALRDKLIASRSARTSSAMDPPPAPSSAARPVDSASSKRDSPTSSDRLNSSRPASPRGSDAGRRSDRPRASSRERADDSSSRRDREKDPKDSKDRERTSSNKDSRPHEGHRSSRHDDEDRRKSSSHREPRGPADRTTERTADRTVDRERPSREEARRLEDKLRDERRDERRRDERPSVSGSGTVSGRPPRENDRAASTAGGVIPPRNLKDESRFSSSNRVEPSRGPAPALHRGDSNSLGDRLKPPPARQPTSLVTSGPVGIPPPMEGPMLIRGRGLGNSLAGSNRLMDNALGRAPDRRPISTGRGAPDDVPMSSSSRRDGEDSKKRSAPPSSNAALLSRFGGGTSRGSGSGGNELDGANSDNSSKRPRTDDRDPSRQQERRGSGGARRH